MRPVKHLSVAASLFLVAAYMPVHAINHETVCSPDGQLKVTLTDSLGVPYYNVVYKGNVFMKNSPLGMNTNVGDFSRGMTLSSASDNQLIDETYQIANIKKSNVHYVANRRVFTYSSPKGKAFNVEFQVGNNDIAFRYEVLQQGDSLCCVVNQEATSFAMPAGTTTFMCPQAKPMSGFARTSPSYETGYTPDDAIGKNGWGEGYTFPCLFRLGDKGWMLISETGVNSNYCGSRLIGHADGTYTIGFPNPDEANGNGTSAPGLPLPGFTPWRTITVGETLAPIVETTVSFDVVKPLYQPSKKYTYGAGSWSWIIGMDESVNYDETKRYIDFSAAMGWQSVLVDNWWDKQIGREKIEELAQYAKQKGVSLFLWYNSNGYWNDASQTPRNIMNNLIRRRQEMTWLKKIGVKGVKVDFFGSDKQQTMQLMEEILADANDFGLEVIFHGCTLPRGWERMYPNFVACEAVLASENLHFTQQSCDNEAFNATLHPFIRNTVASMDFGGSALNHYYNKLNNAQMWGGHRVTSDVFALATAVLFQSSMQHFALAPNNLTDAPAWAIDFMKKVPTTWDDIKFIDGYPGKYVVLARRHGQNWYVAGVNAEMKPITLKLSLDMIPAGSTVNLYSDNKKLEGRVKTVRISKQQTLTVTMPCNGGFVITQE